MQNLLKSDILCLSYKKVHVGYFFPGHSVVLVLLVVVSFSGSVQTYTAAEECTYITKAQQNSLSDFYDSMIINYCIVHFYSSTVMAFTGFSAWLYKQQKTLEISTSPAW